MHFAVGGAQKYTNVLHNTERYKKERNKQRNKNDIKQTIIQNSIQFKQKNTKTLLVLNVQLKL